MATMERVNVDPLQTGKQRAIRLAAYVGVPIQEDPLTRTLWILPTMLDYWHPAMRPDQMALVESKLATDGLSVEKRAVMIDGVRHYQVAIESGDRTKRSTIATKSGGALVDAQLANDVLDFAVYDYLNKLDTGR